MAATVNAQGYGHCSYGNFPYGNCTIVTPIPPPTEGGGGGSAMSPIFECPEGTFQIDNSCFDNSLKDYLTIINESIFLYLFSPQQGVLEYKIESPKFTYIKSSINITNNIENEGDIALELHCTNFIDLNKNGIGEFDEPIYSFNKRAEPGIKHRIIVQLQLTENILPGDYVIIGICDLTNSRLPSARSITKMQIYNIKEYNKKENIRKFMLFSSIIIPVILIIVMITFLIIMRNNTHPPIFKR